MLEATRAAVARHGAARVAVLVGTSTSSIGETERAYAQLEDDRFPPASAALQVHTPHALGDFVRLATGAEGPCMTVATACSSSAKVFAHAARLLKAGVVDAALVGAGWFRAVRHDEQDFVLATWTTAPPSTATGAD